MDCYKMISYDGQEYAVCKMRYKGYKAPVVLDWDDYKAIKKLNKNWRCGTNGFVSCSHTVEGSTPKEVYLHELVMLLNNQENGLENQKSPIIHINRIGLDNRRENLIYDTVDKELNKNLQKKRRTIYLPREAGINPDKIPTYIWYMKPDSSHGERFTVNIGDINWKTTSSNNLSLKYKLEEAKLYLRHLLRSRPDLMEEYSMNGDYNREGMSMAESYYDIVDKAGFNNIQKIIPNNTVSLLQPDYDDMDNNELYSLSQKRKLFKSQFH